MFNFAYDNGEIMIEINGNMLFIDEKSTQIENINIIKSIKNKLYFSNNIVEISPKSHNIDEVYSVLQQAGLSNFVLINNAIVNASNIESMYIKYYQYAGLSILQCEKGNAEMCNLILCCKNGKEETISFPTTKEAEKCYHILDAAVADIKNRQVYEKLAD